MSELPHLDFFVIGAYKAATTTLHHALRAHPDVFVPEHKEPSYLVVHDRPDMNGLLLPGQAITDLARYRGLYADTGNALLSGDISPEYMCDPHAAEVIAQHYPRARLIAILRDPVERAFSDWLMYRRDGLEPAEDFLDAIDQQQARSGQPNGRYLTTGLYGQQLARYYERFDADKILVLFQHDLGRDRDETLGRMADFLGIDRGGFADAPIESNRSGVPESAAMKAAYWARRRAKGAARFVPESAKLRIDSLLQRGLVKPELTDNARDRVAHFFAADVELTERLTGADLSAWKR